MKITQIIGFCFCLSFIAKAQEVVPFTQVENTYNFLLHKPENKDNQIKPVILFLLIVLLRPKSISDTVI